MMTLAPPFLRTPSALIRLLAGAGGVVIGFMAIAGCAPVIDTRGNMADPEIVETIRPGEQTKAQVAELLGTPSSVATFDPDIWYYVGRKTIAHSILTPEMVDQKIVTIHFDKQGVVAKVTESGPETAQAIIPNEDETPTFGNNTNLLQRLFGNIGRFNSPSGRISPSGRPGQL